MKRVFMTLMGESQDPKGNPLALVIYRDRSWEYIPHKEFGL
ncbi:hypothetical protein [Mycobacteroides chelonae]|nr:hypothetical protein [Mycobacteroides chelonae]